MKKYLAFFDGLSKVWKIIFALPVLDILWAVYRLFSVLTRDKKDVLTIVTTCLLIVVGIPILWNNIMDEFQRKRFEILWNPAIDPQGIDERYHLVRSLKSLTAGGMTGQGLFNGNRTQAGALPSQHTDFIFSAIGEEMGYVGCALVLIMLFAVIARCIWVGTHSQDFMRRLVCFGAASALMFQVIVNAGMCMGVMPVIGLTLPLISYGGSSIVTIYAMLGLVSGVYARPAPRSYERYIRPPM